MLNESLPKDRKIAKFPESYKADCSPYKHLDFSEVTYQKCLTENKNSSSWMNICKVIIIGDVSVGKTCIVNRFCQKIFDSNYKSTIGVDFEIQHFDIMGFSYTLQIWDTAGQERFKSIAQSYYRGAGVIMVVFDLTNFESLSNCRKWLSEALNANSIFCPLLFLVGTKMDLLKPYALKNVEEYSMKIARHLNAEYWSVSSKSGKNIEKLFFRVAALTFDEYIKKEVNDLERSIKIGDNLEGCEKQSEKTAKCVRCQIN